MRQVLKKINFAGEKKNYKNGPTFFEFLSPAYCAATESPGLEPSAKQRKEPRQPVLQYLLLVCLQTLHRGGQPISQRRSADKRNELVNETVETFGPFFCTRACLLAAALHSYMHCFSGKCFELENGTVEIS